jgi:hypothetical protein
MPITIKCHGEYYSREGQLKFIRPFREDVNVPSLKFFEETTDRYIGTDDKGKLQFRSTTFTNVRGKMKKKLLPLILNQKYEGSFIRVRNVVIDEVVMDPKEATELPITLMSMAQLGALAKQQNIPLDPDSYVNVDELRSDILEYKQSPELFQENYARKQAKRVEERSFREMNGLIPKAKNKAPATSPF